MNEKLRLFRLALSDLRAALSFVGQAQERFNGLDEYEVTWKELSNLYEEIDETIEQMEKNL